jgi:hypothetical protein
MKRFQCVNHPALMLTLTGAALTGALAFREALLPTKLACNTCTQVHYHVTSLMDGARPTWSSINEAADIDPHNAQRECCR